MSDTFILQEDTTIDDQVSKSGEMFLRSSYLILMRFKKNGIGKSVHIIILWLF